VIEQCPPGTYSLGSQSSCTECPSNKQCEHRDSVADLQDGFYSPQGTGVALICPAGWTCTQQGLAAPVVEPCPRGTWSATGSTACTPCGEGKMCPMSGQSGFECAEGFIQALTGQDTCTVCPFGQHATDATTCAAAVPG
jgi:hypothetical protein